jgi:hypothetical protein
MNILKSRLPRVVLPLLISALSLSSAQGAVTLYEGTFNVTFPSTPSGYFVDQGIPSFSGAWSAELDDSLVNSALAEQKLDVSLLSFYSDPSVIGSTTLANGELGARFTYEYGVLASISVGMKAEGAQYDSFENVQIYFDDFLLGYDAEGNLISAFISDADYAMINRAGTDSGDTLSGGVAIDGVPEPSSALLALTGVAALAGVRRRR